MVDEEVENTLREIRERVRQQAEFEADTPSALETGATNGSQPATKTAETLARIDAYLTTTARAWDRLPPLVSKRHGGLARLELWVKRRFKQATHWYSWEQVNFNAAVHHALRDTLDALLDLEQQIRQLRAEMEVRTQTLRTESQRAAETYRTQTETYRTRVETYRAQTEAYRVQMEAEQQARNLNLDARLDDLTRELRERDQQRLEEQRVCFKQLSLEVSEAEVLLDRVRRDLESRLAKLESAKN